MKKIIFLLFLLVVFQKGISQVNDNCINAIPLCSNPSFTFFTNSGPGSIIDFSVTSSVSNPTNNPFPPNSGCLQRGEYRPQWLLLTIGNAGLLEFVFGAGNRPNAQAGCYDWAMWPYSPSTCAAILANTLPPVRCNWNGTCAGGTGIASATNMATFGGNTIDFEPPLAVNACQQFVICISNYSGVNTLVSFQSLGSASLSCNPNCNPNYTICSGASATIFPVNYSALGNPVFSIQPGGFTNTTGSFVVIPTVTSSYTTYITGLNSSNAVETVTAISTVSVNAQPSAAPTVTNTTCTSTLNAVDLHLTFTPTATPAYTVNWSPIPNGVSNPLQTAFTGGINAGTYNATITTAAGCRTSANFTVNPAPAQAVIVVNPLGSSHTITCLSGVTLTAINPAYNYTWSSNVAVFSGPAVVFNSTLTGLWTLTAEEPSSGCVSTKTFVISQNTLAPVGTAFPALQSITCNFNSIQTVTATSNMAVNITHQFFSPQGGTFSSGSQTLNYIPGGVGVYTHCVVNDANGCSSCSMFTVTSNLQFPTFTIFSPQNFTLGCGSRSFAAVQIMNPNVPGGGAATFTLLASFTGSLVSGPLSSTSSYVVNAPGTYTAITRANQSLCDTRTVFSILSNTFAPDISAEVPSGVLDCANPRVTLRGQSLTNNVSYVWEYPNNQGLILSDTISVFTLSASATTTVIGDYTLTVTDNNSTCKSFSVIPMRQNLFPPVALIAPYGTTSLTCRVPALQLVHQSTTSIPPTSGFPYQQPVIAYIWDGPSPQKQSQVSTYYDAAVVGVYTLTAKDLNNGCTAIATKTLLDGKGYPVVAKPSGPPVFTLDCGSVTKSISPDVISPASNLSYSWVPVQGAIFSGANTRSLTTNLVGDYRVMVTNSVNGCSSLAEVRLINGTLKADFEFQPAKGFAPLPVTFFNNSASSLGSGGITSYWNFSNGTSSVTTISDLSATTTYSLPGTYKITMTAVKGTCIETLSKVVEVEIPSSLVIPNVFTPNGDNVNDVFFIKMANLENTSLYIYDRWGHIVYYSAGEGGNVEWDGRSGNGKEVADGTYFYLVRSTGRDGVAYDKKGTVSLYR